MCNVEEEVTKIISFVQTYYRNNKLGGAVLGISGGKDSAVVAALLVKALGKENVIGFTLPCHSKEQDAIDAKLISDFYGFPLYNFDITNTFDTFKAELAHFGSFTEEETKNSDINLKPKLRMATLYYFAALFTATKGKPYLVAGTSNESELYVGYFTKGGDSVCDIALIADFTKEEVIEIGAYLKVPEKVLYKIPSDGLSDQSDEDKLGVRYEDIRKYLEDPTSVSKTVRQTIETLHLKNKHKFEIPTYKRDI